MRRMMNTFAPQAMPRMSSNIAAMRPGTPVRRDPTVLPPPISRWHSLIRHPLLMPYNRLIVAMVALNVLAFADLSTAFALVDHGIGLQTLSNMVLANFAIAIVIRTQDVINLMFRVATSVPRHWPIGLRWAAAKVYHFGGIHVGAFFSGTVWLTLYALSTSGADAAVPAAVTAMVWVHVGVLVAVSIVALPPLRARYHDVFERVARFGGWASLALFWAQAIALFDGGLAAAVTSPQLWVLAGLTCLVALPWLRLRRVAIDIETPSSHVALSRFDYGVTPFEGCSVELSRSPVLEWHAFATIVSPGVDGYRLAISRAGDWTGELIDDAPKSVWVKGIPTAGVGNVERCFERVIWVATGSGVGPCIPHLLAGTVPSRLVWSTRDPATTYGEGLVGEILDAQPDAVIWNTQTQGKPDLVELAYKAYVEFDAEAVICISNKKLTWQVTHALESRGIPTFGAIWDS